MASRTASRAALLELRNERQVIEDGHRFLDEKRALLAHEVLARLGDFAAALERFRRHEQSAVAALALAVEAAGLETVQLYPPLRTVGGELVQRRQSFLGTPMVAEASWQAASEAERTATRPEPEPTAAAGDCARAFATAAEEALGVATELGNLLRLVEEFQRTQRRVRALENVVLPELADEETRMEEVLEDIDQEDAIRVRLAGRGR